jgi:hypothetical protein
MDEFIIPLAASACGAAAVAFGSLLVYLESWVGNKQ